MGRGAMSRGVRVVLAVSRAAAVCSLAAALTLTLGGCGTGSSPAAVGHPGTSGHPVNVVASTDVYGDIAKTVGGDRVRVVSFITDPDQDPHSYEANAQNQLAVSKSDLVIENGGGYDDFVDRMVKASHTKATVLNVVELSGKKGAAGQELNEHVWYDFPTVERLAHQVATDLSAADPAGASLFETNAAAFTKRVEGLVTEESELKATYAGEGVAITEPVPLYLLQAVGLTDRTPAAFSAAVESGQDVSASVLKQTLEQFSQSTVAALVYNEQTSGPITEQIKKAAQKARIPVVPVTETLPENHSYIAWMSDNLANLKRALSQ
jgi:zinc/manganese transport system substrate-binding protein